MKRTEHLKELNKYFRMNTHVHNVCAHMCACVCILRLFSGIWFFATLWTVVPSGSSLLEILQARILEWVAMPFSKESAQPRYQTQVSCVPCIGGGLFTTSNTGKPQSSHTCTKSPIQICSLWIVCNSKKLQISQTFGMKYNETGKRKVQCDIFVI